MWRRKMRSALTILGIAVGIYAFTVMGSMAARFNKMIGGGKKFITGQITLAPKGTSFTSGAQGGMLPIDLLDRIAKVDGVESAAPGIELAMNEPDPDNPTGGMSFGMPPTIEGMDLNRTARNRNWETLDMKEGRMLEKGDPDDAIVIGISIATDKKVGVGDTLAIRGRDFHIIGVVDQTLTGPDSYVFMPITPARELFVAANPFLKSLKEQADQTASITDAALAKLPADVRAQVLEARTFKMENVNTGAAVAWKDGYDPDIVATAIKNQFKDEVMVLSPKAMGEQIDKASAIFNALILGSALIALVVGGFSIINTMLMSISERTKE
ncbi:MAG: ABC transporter permease, partial [bacterium]